MAQYPPFDLAPITRRARNIELPPKPGPTSFLIEAVGEQATVIRLDARLAAALQRLCAAGPAGISGGDPKESAIIRELRAAGVPITTTRVPKVGCGLGHIARYALGADVTRVAVD